VRHALIELEALQSRASASEDVGLHDRLSFFQVHGYNGYLQHAGEHLTIFAEPESELERVPHGDWQRDGVDLEFPAIVSPDDLAFWRSMRLVLRMAAMRSNHTAWRQGTAAQYE
jgi:hypothetical protein